MTMDLNGTEAMAPQFLASKATRETERFEADARSERRFHVPKENT